MIVKHSYISAKVRLAGAKSNWGVAKQKALGAAIDHLKYIQSRPGPDREGLGRPFFDASDDRIQGKEVRDRLTERYPGQNVVAHKLLLAPELDPVDEREYARQVMKSLENKLGQDLDWYAVAHKNTDNHHLHVVVLPKDKNGKQVKINLKDCEELKKTSDLYLSREQPLAWERVELEREQRAFEKSDLLRDDTKRKKCLDRDELLNQRPNYDKGALPFFGTRWNLMLEAMYPYEQWKKEQEGIEKKPREREVVVVDGKEYSRTSSLADLKELKETLWQKPYEERIPHDQFCKLTGWIFDKEPQPGQAARYRDLESSKDPDKFTYKDKEYTKESTHLEFRELMRDIHTTNTWERHRGLPITRLAPEDSDKLTVWRESAERQYGADKLNQVMGVSRADASHAQDNYQTEQQQRANPAGGGNSPLPFLFAKPARSKQEAKLIRLPKDDIQLAKNEVDALTTDRDKAWKKREGKQQQDLRRQDEKAIEQYKVTRENLEKVQAARQKSKRIKRQKLKEAYIRGTEDIEITKQGLELDDDDLELEL